MTIAYNSAYVQTETLNFTFAQQAIIVYFDAECSRMSILRMSTVKFLPIAVKPSIDVKLEYIFGKPVKHRLQQYIVRTVILSTFHA